MSVPEQEQQTAPVEPSASENDPQQETFSRDYVEQLRKENARYRTEAKANAEAASELTALQEAQKSEEQKRTERIAALEAENAGFKARDERAKWVSEVAEEVGLDAALVGALAGATKDELLSSAESVKSALPAMPEPVSDPAQPVPTAGQVPGAVEVGTLTDQIAAAEKVGDADLVKSLKVRQLGS